MNSERELFEEWYLKEFGDDYTMLIAQLDKRGDEYIDFHAQDTWLSWQASANRQGYKLVPVEPTEEMYSIGYDCRVQNGSTIDIYKAMIEAADD